MRPDLSQNIIHHIQMIQDAVRKVVHVDHEETQEAGKQDGKAAGVSSIEVGNSTGEEEGDPKVINSAAIEAFLASNQQEEGPIVARKSLMLMPGLLPYDQGWRPEIEG